MNINKRSDELVLAEGEEIIYTSKSYTSNLGVALCAFLAISPVFLEWIVIGFFQGDFLLFISIIIIIPSFTLFFANGVIREKGTVNFITSKRIVQIKGKGIFPNKSRQIEMDFLKLGFIREWEGMIMFVEKTKDNPSFDIIDGISSFDRYARYQKKIYFRLESKKARIIQGEIMKQLIEKFLLMKHPSIKSIYLRPY